MSTKDVENNLQNEDEKEVLINKGDKLCQLNSGKPQEISKERDVKSNELLTSDKEVFSFEIDENTIMFDVYKGMMYMFISCVFRTIFSTLGKFSLTMNKQLTPYQQITFFTYFYFAITIFTLAISDVKVFSSKFLNISKFPLLLLRNILAITSIVLLTVSVKYMHISDVFSVFFIYPAIVIIFSIIFLGEKTWWFDYVCCLSCFIGAIFIVKPDFLFHDKQTNSNNFFFILVIISAFIKATEDITTRFIGKDIHFQAINLVYSSIGVIVFPMILIVFDDPVPKLLNGQWIIFLLSGTSAWLYQTFATLAFQNENAGRVSMINYLQVDFLYLIDLYIFAKPMIFTDLLGTILIFSFNFANGLYKTIKRFRVLECLIEKKKLLKLENKSEKEKLERNNITISNTLI